jgi:hypothetical protein
MSKREYTGLVAGFLIVALICAATGFLLGAMWAKNYLPC